MYCIAVQRVIKDVLNLFFFLWVQRCLKKNQSGLALACFNLSFGGGLYYFYCYLYYFNCCLFCTDKWLCAGGCTVNLCEALYFSPLVLDSVKVWCLHVQFFRIFCFCLFFAFYSDIFFASHTYSSPSNLCTFAQVFSFCCFIASSADVTSLTTWSHGQSVPWQLAAVGSALWWLPAF